MKNMYPIPYIGGTFSLHILCITRYYCTTTATHTTHAAHEALLFLPSFLIILIFYRC